MAALKLSHVTKRFGDFTAVDDLSFEAPEGKIFGFLGPNGAGKTTSLRMVLDMLPPTAGTIEVLGRAPGRARHAEIGFLPEERGLYKHMTAFDIVRYFGELKGLNSSVARESARYWLERLGLGAAMNLRVDALSKGMAQKVQLATALVNAPRLLLLDEPFSGLDPVNQGDLEDIILEQARNGATVVFSTHVMQHAERLCDRLMLIARGRKLFDGTQEQARRTLPLHLTLIARDDPGNLPHVIHAAPAARTDDWTEWDVTLAPGADPADVLEACCERGLRLRKFDTHPARLHDVFVHLVSLDRANLDHMGAAP